MADDFLGLDFKLIMAGVGGGVSILCASAMKKPEAWELVVGVVVGGFTANYLTVPVSKVFPFSFVPPDYILSVAFFVGIGGKLICRLGLDYWKSKTRIRRH